MERLDLEQPRFVQSELLQMIPALTPKMIENWMARVPGLKTGERLGSGRKRTYSGAGVVVMATMVQLVNLGIKPSEAFDIAYQLGSRAIALHNAIEPEIRDGLLRWVAKPQILDLYHRGLIVKQNGKHKILIGHGEQLEQMRLAVPLIHITIEVDMLIMGLLNSIYRQAAGREQLEIGKVELIDEAGQAIDDPAASSAWQRVKSFSTPGGGDV